MLITLEISSPPVEELGVSLLAGRVCSSSLIFSTSILEDFVPKEEGDEEKEVDDKEDKDIRLDVSLSSIVSIGINVGVLGFISIADAHSIGELGVLDEDSAGARRFLDDAVVVVGCSSLIFVNTELVKMSGLGYPNVRSDRFGGRGGGGMDLTIDDNEEGC